MPDERDDAEEREGPRRPSFVRYPAVRTTHPGPDGNVTREQHTAASDRARTTSADPRFSNAPLTPGEMKALHEAPTLDAACELLGRMHEDRLKEGRLPQAASRPQTSTPLIDTYVSTQEQISKALMPTPQQLAHLQSAASPEDEKTLTADYLAERRAQNVALFERSRYWEREIDRLTHAGQPYDDRITEAGIQAWRANGVDMQEPHYHSRPSPRALAMASAKEVTDTSPREGGLEAAQSIDLAAESRAAAAQIGGHTSHTDLTHESTLTAEQTAARLSNEQSAQREVGAHAVILPQDAAGTKAERDAGTEQTDAKREKSDRDLQRDARDALLRDHDTNHAEQTRERGSGGREM